ncbi:MAG: hypothetical protein ABI614_06120 [Planctomycetota bacterium]
MKICRRREVADQRRIGPGRNVRHTLDSGLQNEAASKQQAA